MLARIYQPARSAMQSGRAASRSWTIEYAPVQARAVDPLMGWTSSGDMASQVRLTFGSRAEAIAFAESNGLAYEVSEPKKRRHFLRQNGYGDNFASGRRGAWTH